MSFRKLLFWTHLICGLAAGAIIAILSLTGASIAFEKQILTWAERDVARVRAPAGASKLSIDDLLKQARETRPENRPSAITLTNDPAAAITLTAGRAGTYYVNPYTGEMRDGTAPCLRAFFQTMTEWHRWLGAGNERRSLGKAITGAANLVFLLLAVSGLILWWPRALSWRAVKPSLWFVRELKGKARDWNWHNAVGFWCAPVLIVLTLTGAVMSYRWASDLVYKLAGDPVPAPPAAAAVEVPAPATDAKPLSPDALLATVQDAFPSWEQITLRSGPRGNSPATSGTRAGGTPAVSISIRERQAWPRFASIQLSLNPFTGAVLRTEAFSDYNAGRKTRAWMRYLHTGEAFGSVGQTIAASASLGATLLVWTGFALAFRRLSARGATRNLDSKNIVPSDR